MEYKEEFRQQIIIGWEYIFRANLQKDGETAGQSASNGLQNLQS